MRANKLEIAVGALLITTAVLTVFVIVLAYMVSAGPSAEIHFPKVFQAAYGQEQLEEPEPEPEPTPEPEPEPRQEQEHPQEQDDPPEEEVVDEGEQPDDDNGNGAGQGEVIEPDTEPQGDDDTVENECISDGGVITDDGRCILPDDMVVYDKVYAFRGASVNELIDRTWLALNGDGNILSDDRWRVIQTVLAEISNRNLEQEYTQLIQSGESCWFDLTLYINYTPSFSFVHDVSVPCAEREGTIFPEEDLEPLEHVPGHMSDCSAFQCLDENNNRIEDSYEKTVATVEKELRDIEEQSGIPVIMPRENITGVILGVNNTGMIDLKQLVLHRNTDTGQVSLILSTFPLGNNSSVITINQAMTRTIAEQWGFTLQIYDMTARSEQLVIVLQETRQHQQREGGILL